MTEVGKTHDVVIYDGAGNIAPVGLIVKPYSYRVGQAPTFIPRMAVGDPRGTDYATFTSYVQEDWRGKSQIKRGDTHSYHRLAGIAPDRRTGDLLRLEFPVAIAPDVLLNGSNVPCYAKRIPTCAGVETQVWSKYNSDSRVFVGNYILMPKKSLEDFTSLATVGQIPSSFRAYDAVQFSGVAFITTYTWTTDAAGYKPTCWRDIYAHVNDTIYKPVSSTYGQRLAVYDDKLWRSEPEGHRIAYYDIREPPTVHDTNQGTLSYLGDGGSAEFRDDGQDFSEWQTEEGDATYKLVVTNSDSSECWGYMGEATDSNHDINIYNTKEMSNRGWLGDTNTPQGDGKVANSYEIRNAVPPEEEVTGWSDWIPLDPGSRIRAMESFIGRLFVGCEDSLWAYEAGRTYKVADFRHLADRRNFYMMRSGHGSLWFNIGQALYRYTAGGLLEELSILTRYLGSAGLSWPIDIATGPGCMYVLAGGIGLSGRRVPTPYRFDVETGAAQELVGMNEIKSGGYFDNSTIVTARARPATEAHPWGKTQLLVGPLYTTLASTSGALRFLNFGDVTNFLSDEDLMGATAATGLPDVSFFETVWIDVGYPALYKTWSRVTMTLDLATAVYDQGVMVQYRTSQTSSWVTLGTVGYSDLDESGMVTLDFPSGIASKSLQLKVHFLLGDMWPQTRTRLSRLEVDCLLGGSGVMGTIKRQLSFDAIVTDDLELLDMTVENSAAFIAAALYSFAQGGAIHTVALPFPPPVGHTTSARVSLGEVGAVVPVFPTSYTAIPSGCPGADFHVIITEV